MSGDHWESLPYPIIIDSGARAPVIPISWCRHIPVEEADKSRARDFFRAANGQKIYNEGQKLVTLMTREGIMRDMSFTACDVSKALGSVSQMGRSGHKVVFNPPGDPNGSYILHVETGQKMWLVERDGIYLLDVRVAPEHKQANNGLDFARQGP